MKTTKREERKIIIKFVLILVASMILGAVSSIVMACITQGGLLELGGIGRAVGAAVPYVFGCSNLLAAIVAITLCHRAKREINAWDGEDECIDRTEGTLSYSLLLANGMTVLNFLLFSASIEAAAHVAQDQRALRLLLGCLAIFVLGYVWIIYVSNRVVKLEKQINPEKRGNIFDMKFQKQWMASCDEAQKQLIYQCGYRAYRMGSTVCMLLWVVALLAQLWTGTGMFPAVCICVIWLTMMLSYQMSAIRLERHS